MSRNDFPGLKKGTNFSLTSTRLPVLGFLPTREFLCLTEKLELTDILEFLYTGILSEKIIKSATDCDISKEEIENIDLSEILGN